MLLYAAEFVLSSFLFLFVAACAQLIKNICDKE